MLKLRRGMILVVDDEPGMCHILKRLMSDQGYTVNTAGRGEEALKLIAQDNYDVILLDIRMPDGDGLATLEKLRAKVPDSRVVMLSTYDNPTYIARAVALGASDYVLKGSTREALIETITSAAQGESPSRSGELRRVAGAMKIRQVIDDDDVPLTQRETQVLRHVALGLSNKEIGRSLEISVETVKEHVQNILRKIAVSDRTQAAVWAVRKGLV